jgi:ribosomal-protein-alanine N-acetyltransferase
MNQLLQLPPRIETQRLHLQRLRYEDAEEIFYAYGSKPEVTKFLSFPTHQSIGDARNFLNYAIPAWDAGKEYVYSIRLKENYRLIGSFGFVHEQGNVHFGYCISPTHWGHGYVTEAGKALLSWVRKEKSVYRIWAFADAENIASHKVLLKCGLQEEARLEKWFRFINQDNEPKDCILFLLKEQKVADG